MANIHKQDFTNSEQTPIDNEHDLIDAATACKVIGGAAKPIHRSTLCRLAKNGTLPSPIQIGPRIKRWSRAECEASARRSTGRDGSN